MSWIRQLSQKSAAAAAHSKTRSRGSEGACSFADGAERRPYLSSLLRKSVDTAKKFRGNGLMDGDKGV